MKTYKFILIALTSLFFIGCEDYLDEAPSKSDGVVPSTIQDLEGLLNQRTTFSQEDSNALFSSTDDFALNSAYFDVNNAEFNVLSVQNATWNNEFPAFDMFNVWNGEWEKIFIANIVLQGLDLIEGDATEKENLKAEAHFIRAYSYFLLANTYCLALNGNESEMGLPIKRSTSSEEPLKRVSLQDTYNFITSDVEEALKITRKLVAQNGLKRVWRASTASVNSFAARYYLALHDYDKAEQYAQDALDEHNVLINFNTGVAVNNQDVVIESDGDPNTPETATLMLPEFLGNSSGFPNKYVSEEYYYDREMGNPTGDIYPSDNLLDVYDQTNDLRFQYLMIENHSYRRGSDGINGPLFSQTGYVSIGAGSNAAISAPSVPEMYLILAESQIRKGDFNAGLATVNILRRTRMDSSAPASAIDLIAGSQTEALTKVLEERRRELPFVLRWYDIKRYNSNDDSSDDIDNLTKSFYPYSQSTVDGSGAIQTYTLPKGSRRFAHPIPDSEIVTSGGVIEQNQY